MKIKVGATVEVKCSDKKEFVEATIQKIQDCSQYTVGMNVNYIHFLDSDRSEIDYLILNNSNLIEIISCSFIIIF